MRPGRLPQRDARGDLAPREPGYANEAVHRASNGLGGARLSDGGWERVTPAVRDRPGRLKHNSLGFAKSMLKIKHRISLESTIKLVGSFGLG